MHTEDEAQKKWCPEVRVVGLDYQNAHVPVSLNAIARQDNAGIERTKCIASECMHWRWAPPFHMFEETKGYCGLSGKPS